MIWAVFNPMPRFQMAIVAILNILFWWFGPQCCLVFPVMPTINMLIIMAYEDVCRLNLHCTVCPSGRIYVSFNFVSLLVTFFPLLVLLLLLCFVFVAWLITYWLLTQKCLESRPPQCFLVGHSSLWRCVVRKMPPCIASYMRWAGIVCCGNVIGDLEVELALIWLSDSGPGWCVFWRAWRGEKSACAVQETAIRGSQPSGWHLRCCGTDSSQSELPFFEFIPACQYFSVLTGPIHKMRIQAQVGQMPCMLSLWWFWSWSSGSFSGSPVSCSLLSRYCLCGCPMSCTSE